MEDNPMRKVRKAREPRGRARYLTDLEREILLVAWQKATSSYLIVVVVLARSAGMRRGEITGPAL